MILHIETATGNCSVSVSDDEQILATVELNEGFTHAEHLHPFIEQALQQANLKPTQLNAVAVSAGPGSYTGLRIGLSAAKGLCYALNIPLISVSTLQSLSAGAVKFVEKEDALLCPMLDARRMEVYTAMFDRELNEIKKTEPKIMDENSIKEFDKGKTIYFFGDGVPKCKELLEKIRGSKFIEGFVPSSKHMIAIALKKYSDQQFEDVAYFEPFYLKEYFFKTK